MKITTGLIAILITAFLVIVGMLFFLTLSGKDSTGFVSVIGTLLTTVVGFVILLRTQEKQGSTIDAIKTQTNGTLSALTASNQSLVNKLNVALGKLPPADAQSVIESTISRDQLPSPVDVSAGVLPIAVAPVPVAPVTETVPSV